MDKRILFLLFIGVVITPSFAVNINNVSITPHIPEYKTNDLNCSFVAVGNQSTYDVNVTWYKNKQHTTAYDTLVSCNNATTCYTNVSVPASATNIGDRWICHASSGASYNFSGYQKLTTFTTGNSEESYVYGASASSKTYYISLPKEATVVHSALAISDTNLPAWYLKPELAAGLRTGLGPSPAIAFNVTGDGKWILIAGLQGGGSQGGFYWNDTKWISDNSKTEGITAAEWLTIAFNVTGDGKWELVSGDGGDIYGHYWNGSQWLNDSSRVAGVDGAAGYANPVFVFNQTGDNRWKLIVGRYPESDMGFSWNGTQWIEDNSLAGGVSIVATKEPTSGFNISGGGNIELMTGSQTGGFYGRYWNGTQWLNNPDIKRGLSRYGGSYTNTPETGLAFNITGDGNWALVVGYQLGTFKGFEWYTETPLSPYLIINNSVVWNYTGTLTSATTTNMTDAINNYLNGCTTDQCNVPIALTTNGYVKLDIGDTVKYSNGTLVAGIQIDNITTNWVDGNISLDVNVTHVNGDNCTFGGYSGAIVNNVSHIDIADTHSQNGDVTCYTSDGYNDTKFINFTFVDSGNLQHTENISNLTTQYVKTNIGYTNHGNQTQYNITETVNGGTCIGSCTATGTNNTSETFYFYGDWLNETEYFHSVHQDYDYVSNYSTQFVYNQTQINITNTLSVPFVGIRIDSCLTGSEKHFSLVNDSAPWGTYWMQGIAAKDNKLWVVGGRVYGGTTSDTTSRYTTDGNSWVTVNNSLPFGGLLKMVTYNGSFYAVTEGYTNDIWYSTDGGNWTTKTTSASFGDRLGFGFITYNNKLWVVGGRKSNGEEKNDVWSSTDGGNWTEVNSSCAWDGDEHLKLVVHNNSLWLIGGTQNTGEVWRSTDGGNWTQVTSSAYKTGFPSSGFDVVSYDDKIWVVGGYYNKDHIFYSTDGISWSKLDSIPDIHPYPRVSVYNNALWLVDVGAIYNSSMKLDIAPGETNHLTDCNHNKYSGDWLNETNIYDGVSQDTGILSNMTTQFVYNKTALDINNTLGIGLTNINYNAACGTSWKLINESSGFPGREGHTSLVFNDKMWVLGGYTVPSSNDVWSSTDGGNWTQVTSNASWSARWMHQSVVFDNKMWVIGGVGGGNSSWYSIDGENWSQAPDIPSARWGGKLLNYNGKMWLIGGYSNDVASNDVWSSTDGITWTEVNNSCAWSPRGTFGATTFDNKMWIMGGYDNDGDALNDVWSSTDGGNWTQVTSNASWSARGEFETISFDKKLWVIGGEGACCQPESKDVWYSDDGYTWYRYDDIPRSGGDAGIRREQLVEFNKHLWLIGGFSNSGGYLNEVWAYQGGENETINITKTAVIHNCNRAYYHGDWVDSDISYYSKHQNTSAVSDLNTQYVYNQTQLKVNETLGIDWSDIQTSCDKEGTSIDISSGDTNAVKTTNCTWVAYSGDWLNETEFFHSVHQNTTATSTLSTQYVYNQTSLNVTDTLGMPTWSDIDVSGTCSLTSNAPHSLSIWKNVTNATFINLGLSGVYNTPVLAYAGKMWSLAGNHAHSSDAGDIWMEYTPAIIHPLPTGTYSNEMAVVYNNKMWLLGGMVSDGLTNEVLYTDSTRISGSNIQWEHAKYNDTSAWEARLSGGAAAFNDSIFVFGGYNNTGYNLNDVWKTTDGENWTFVGNAPWSARWGFGYAVLNDTLYIAGGSDSNNTFDDVWKTTDGENWTFVGNATWSPRSDVAMVAYNNKLYVIGGADAARVYSEIWSSSDGATWSLVSNNSIPATAKYRAVVHNGQVYLLGGSSTSPVITSNEHVLGTYLVELGPSTTMDQCNHNGYSGDWLNETVAYNSKHQNTTAISTLSTQYIYNQTQLEISETRGLNWTGINIAGTCDKNTTNLDIGAGTSGVRNTNCTWIGYSGDYLNETVGNFEQDTDSISYVNGLAYIKRPISIDNSLDVNFTNIDVSEWNTRTSWTCDDASINITGSSYTTPWRCFKSNVIVNSTEEENHTQDVSVQDYILPTDTDLHITADVYVNNTDDAVSYSNVRYINGLLDTTFDIDNGTDMLINPTGTSSLTITKTTYPGTGCSGWLTDTDVYTYSTDFHNGNITGLRFKFNKGSTWSGYQGYVCNKSTDDCDFSTSCQLGEWASIGMGSGGDYLLHSGAPAGFDFEHLSDLQYAVTYSATSGGGSSVGGGGGGSVITCPEGMYYDHTTQQCRRGTLDITPSAVDGNATQGEVKTELFVFKNIGSIRTSVKLVPSISGIMIIPTEFELQTGEEKQIEVRASIPLTATEFQEGIDIYQDGAYFATIPLSYSISVENTWEKQLQPLLGIPPGMLHSITGMLLADTGFGIRGGAAVLLVLVLFGLYNWKRNRKFSWVTFGIAAVVLMVMGGNILL